LFGEIEEDPNRTAVRALGVKTMLVWVADALVLLCPAMSTAQPSGPGAELYIAKGCLGCHGASARGGVGPPLANTKLTVDPFVG